jgi:PmbA protein
MGGALMLYDERIESLTVEEMKDIVLRAEQAAFDADKRVTNSDGAEFGAERGMVVLANSLGFCGSFPYTAASFSVSVLADEPSGKKHNDYWYSANSMFHRLAAPEDVGRRAAARVVRKIGARKVGTREVPVVWEPTMTGALMGVVAGAASGEALFKRSTFLTDFEGQPIAAPLVSITDDATLPGQLGSRPFDGEGVRKRRNVLVEGGVFKQFLFDSYYARRTGRRTTGSASRMGDQIGVGTGNLIWEPGTSDPAAMVAAIQDGLYLTDLMGFGVNQTTGDFSRGAAGLWIESGAIAYAVAEVNVSGNLKDMLKNVDAVGNDLEWRAGTASPTIRMSRLTVSGL